MATSTPNIGLQIPAFNQANWQVPTDYDWNLLDRIFGGEVEVPGLWVANLVVGNISQQIANVFVAESPSGAVPGNTYTLSFSPKVLLGFYVGGLIQRFSVDYTVAANVVTLTTSTTLGAVVYATYLK